MSNPVNTRWEQALAEAARIVAAYRSNAPEGFDPQNVYPAMLVGLAATAAGTGMSIAANEEAQGAIDKARKDELARQEGLQEKGRKLLGQAVQQAQAPRQTQMINKAADTRAAAYAQLQRNAPPAVAPVPTSTNTTVETPAGDAAQRASVSTNAWTRLNNASAAQNSAYGDWQLQREIEQKHTAQEQQLLNNKARGSLSVMPIELEQASHAGDALETMGKVASALGSVSMMYGATVPTAAAPATGPTAAQAAALEQGFGPVSEGYAQSLSPGLAANWRNNPWAQLKFN